MVSTCQFPAMAIFKVAHVYSHLPRAGPSRLWPLLTMPGWLWHDGAALGGERTLSQQPTPEPRHQPSTLAKSPLLSEAPFP